MKLELKHLSPYLPYGLTIRNIMDKSIIEMSVESEIFKYEQKTSLNGMANIMVVINSNVLKPLLKPLSDLMLPNHILGIGFRTMNYELTAPAFTLKQYEYLIENHFDVFGLIEQGLAIDINTID